MNVKLTFALTVAALFALPAVAVAQADLPTQGKRVTGGCEELENCDPLKANDGKMILSTENKPVRMVLFGHFQDLLQRAPLNTQLPDPEQEPDLNRGFLMPTIYTEDQNLPCCKFQNNRFLMFSSPGFVEFLSDGNWRVHQEPGLADEVKIVGIDGNYMYGYWYMSANSKPSGVPAGPDAGVFPAVGVYMKMNMGRFPSTNPSDIIAEGDTGTGFGTNPDPQCTQDVSNPCVTLLNTPQGEVYEFRVPMQIKKPTIPSVWDPSVDEKKHGYIVEVVPYQIEQGQVRYTQSDWRLRTGIDFPPRIVLDIENPMVTWSTRVHTFDDYLFFRWSFTSPWGSYDVDPNALEIQVDGPKKLGPGDIEFINLKHSVDHNGHFKPLNATWRYDYVNNPLPPGNYKLSAMTHNYQNTYMLVWEEEFTVNQRGVPEVESLGGGFGGSGAGRAASGGGGDAPGFEAVAFLGAIAAAAALVAVRRRRA